MASDERADGPAIVSWSLRSPFERLLGMPNSTHSSARIQPRSSSFVMTKTRRSGVPHGELAAQLLKALAYRLVVPHVDSRIISQVIHPGGGS